MTIDKETLDRIEALGGIDKLREDLREISGLADEVGEKLARIGNIEKLNEQFGEIRDLDVLADKLNRLPDVDKLSAQINDLGDLDELADKLQKVARRSTEAQKPRPAAQPANGKASEGAEGWISDLMARVDSEEPASSPTLPAKAAQAPQRPEAISLDVAQMVDPSAAAAAWDRYRHGDSNAFTRRIYVGRGAQTFDEIRRRYRLDPEFRGTVDRYIQEFDRVLASLGQGEASEGVAKTYLLSETGKVYTLLAHAAGKLD